MVLAVPTIRYQGTKPKKEAGVDKEQLKLFHRLNSRLQESFRQLCLHLAVHTDAAGRVALGAHDNEKLVCKWKPQQDALQRAVAQYAEGKELFAE